MHKPTKVVGRRVGAFLIDWLILQVVNFALFFAMADKDDEIARKVLSGEIDPSSTTYGNVTIGDHEYALVDGKFLVWLLIVLVIAWLYHGVLQGTQGWTPGKLAVGIRTVAEQTGRPPGVGKATVRWLLWIVDSFPWLIPYITGLVTALATQKNQRVGDMVAKTLVVRADAVGQPIRFDQPAYGGGYGQVPPPGGYGQAPPVGGYTPPPPQGQPQPADWYPDPQGQARLRYWDGQGWTDHTSQ
jgi:uncharacterized RDD family membrane protein YckC